jgi:hypothetical protein
MRGASGDKISIPEIAGRLLVGRMAVYQLLESRTIPANRLGWRRIVTRNAYEQVEKTCGMSGAVHISRPALKQAWSLRPLFRRHADGALLVSTGSNEAVHKRCIYARIPEALESGTQPVAFGTVKGTTNCGSSAR